MDTNAWQRFLDDLEELANDSKMPSMITDFASIVWGKLTDDDATTTVEVGELQAALYYHHFNHNVGKIELYMLRNHPYHG